MSNNDRKLRAIRFIWHKKTRLHGKTLYYSLIYTLVVYQ